MAYDRTNELRMSDQALSVLRLEVRAARLRLGRTTNLGLTAPRLVVQLSEIDLPPVVRRYRRARPAKPEACEKATDICSDRRQTDSIHGVHLANKASAAGTPTIRSEKNLEDYLEAHPWLTGQDLLIIGRQLNLGGRIIDLVAVDATGDIYIIELKLKRASPAVITQILGYRRAIKRLDREEIIRVVAAGDLKIDLVTAFERHFGHPLPETVNESQVLIIVAASIHQKTADGILDLLDQGYPVRTFRYVVQPEALRLIPCCRSDRDVEEGTHLETTPTAPPHRVIMSTSASGNYPIDETIRRFWLAHDQDFAPFATFSSIFERYESWVHAQSAGGVPLNQRGLFGRHLSAITAESNEWTRVYVDRHCDMAAYNMIGAPPVTQRYPGGDYTVVAYARYQIGPASEL